MLAFGLTIFTGAFLLFLIQPLIAKFILPWFGGSPAVWTTCMLFFQVTLLGGYAYAHLIIQKLKPRQQVIVHLTLLGLALLVLPITPGDHWKPADGSQPTLRILVLLSACIGLPYLALSATGPLMQAWFSATHPGVSPYRLYALSNAGSLLALVSYPFVVEPELTRRTQALGWSLGLGVFALLAARCGAMVWRIQAPGASPFQSNVSAAAIEIVPSPRGQSWLWLALPAAASVLLLAVTNKLCQDIAVIPFLWVLPLSLYLLSFIICFDSPRWYVRKFWIPLLVISLAAVLVVMLGRSTIAPSEPWLRPVAWLLNKADSLPAFSEIGLHLATLFVACMVCHGEVYRLRPAAQKLTGYYLMISVGGAAGGLFVALVSPFIFKHYFELHTGLFLAGALTALALLRDAETRPRGRRAITAWALSVLAVAGFGWGLIHDARYEVRSVIEISRNFYGVLKVTESNANDEENDKLLLTHGGTTHGLQFVARHKRRIPSSYYASTSGVGRMMQYFPRKTNRRIGVVGLGTGSMAVWANTNDTLRIYEIDDNVLRVARSQFTYLADCPAKVEIVLGDARLSMEREADQNLDLLVLDAFSSDAIPVHLLTREAFEIYRRHLRPDGAIAVHISNRYLKLEPVVLNIGAHFGFGHAIIYDDRDVGRDVDEEATGAYTSDWILLSNNQAFLDLDEISSAARFPSPTLPRIRLWTDEESNLFRILSF